MSGAERLDSLDAEAAARLARIRRLRAAEKAGRLFLGLCVVFVAALTGAGALFYFLFDEPPARGAAVAGVVAFLICLIAGAFSLGEHGHTLHEWRRAWLEVDEP